MYQLSELIIIFPLTEEGIVSIIENFDKATEVLPADKLVDMALTNVISKLYLYQTLLPADLKAAKDNVEYIRNDLVEIRSYLSQHFQFKAKEVLGRK